MSDAAERLKKRLWLLEQDAEASKDYEDKASGERMVMVLWENVSLLREFVEPALAEAEARGRAKGLEEAARYAEAAWASYSTKAFAEDVAAGVRALTQPEPTPDDGEGVPV